MNPPMPFRRTWVRVTLWGVCLAVAGTAAVTGLTRALAQPPAPAASPARPASPAVAGATMAHSCAACHGTFGRLGDEAFAPLAGMPAPQFIASMTEFRDGRRPSTLMGHVAEGFTDPEIRAMADFFAAIPAVEEGVRP